jgi:hypothetical protein
MLTALNSDNDEVEADDVDKGDIFRCPGCNEEVVLKKGDIYEHHFAHRPDSTCNFGGEGPEHDYLKKRLQAWCLKSGYFSDVGVERVFPHNRADIYVETNKGTKIAFEIQCSPLSIATLILRTRAYTELGIYTLWLIPFQSHFIESPMKFKGYELNIYNLYHKHFFTWDGEKFGMVYCKPSFKIRRTDNATLERRDDIVRKLGRPLKTTKAVSFTNIEFQDFRPQNLEGLLSLVYKNTLLKDPPAISNTKRRLPIS